jgi:hypothetical protein
MQRRILAVLAITTTAACVARQAASGPRASESRIQSNGMRTLVGSWDAEFHYDSVRRAGGVVERWRSANHGVARGRVVITKPAQPAGSNRLLSDVRVSFEPAFGRPMSCFTPGRGTVAVEARGTMVTIRFTPGAADCGFSGEGRLEMDSLVGTWSETSLGGPVATGVFRMRRTE